MDKQIAVHVTNEKQWDEVKEYYQGIYLGFNDGKSDYPNEELALDSDGEWSSLECYKNDYTEYEIIEFSEWKERVMGDNMEKIEVPRSVYDEFTGIEFNCSLYSFMKSVADYIEYSPQLNNYLFYGKSKQYMQNQFNLAKVMAGEAEFVPIEEAYYWQDKQESWLGYVDNGSIAIFVNKNMADKITESEIREKTSFNINKLKKVSE